MWVSERNIWYAKHKKKKFQRCTFCKLLLVSKWTITFSRTSENYVPWVVTIRNCFLNLCDECGSYDKCRSHPKYKLMGFYKEHRLSSQWDSIVIIMYNSDKRSEYVPGHVYMVSVVDKLATGQVSLQVIRVFSVNIISLMSYSQLHLQRYSWHNDKWTRPGYLSTKVRIPLKL